MLIRARHAALAPQILHRLPAPLPAAPRAAASAAVASGTLPNVAVPAAFPAAANTAVTAPVMAAAGQTQHPPAASLHIASALAAQANFPPASSSATGATAAALPAALPHTMATAAPALSTAGAGPPQLPNAEATAQLQRPQSSMPAVSVATAGHRGGQGALGHNQPLTGNAVAALAYCNSSTPAPLSASSRPAGTPASLLPGQSTVIPVPTSATGDTTAVAGSGRGVRLVHKASLDVLRLKLRLIDLTQGSAALQPKVSCYAYCKQSV